MTSLIIVTGMAGAGRTTALRALEDAGFEAVDNLPLSLLPTVAAARGADADPLAVGIDSRSRQFSPDHVVALVADLRREHADALAVLYLDCDDDVLLQRFTETRRRHPVADRPVGDAIARERAVMTPVRAIADVRLDTSRLTAQELRRAVVDRFGGERLDKLRIEVVSFSYRVGVPREVDVVFDVRFLRNPHWEPSLQPLTGMEPAVQAFIREDPRFDAFTERLFALLDLLVPAYGEEGKSYLTLGFGCTGGKHRSVFATELVAARLAAQGYATTLRHREQGIVREMAVAPS